MILFHCLFMFAFILCFVVDFLSFRLHWLRVGIKCPSLPAYAVWPPLYAANVSDYPAPPATPKVNLAVARNNV